MMSSIASTPVLHVTVLNKHRDVDFECQGWMMGPKSRTEVRQDGTLVFARYTDRRRIQEFVPKATFTNGMEAERVVLEYAADGPSGDWPRLKDTDFGCGPAIIASDYFLPVRDPTYPEIWRGNMQASKVTETTLRGRACYWYKMDVVVATDSINWNLYVDKETFEPLRQSRLILAEDGTHKKEDIYDYTFEHLADDKEIQWRLDADRLKD